MFAKKNFYNFTLRKYLIIWRRSCVFQGISSRQTTTFKFFTQNSCTERNFVYLCSPIWGIPHWGNNMVVVAQLVRALVCGTRGRGFESHLPPKSRCKRIGFFCVNGIQSSSARSAGRFLFNPDRACSGTEETKMPKNAAGIELRQPGNNKAQNCILQAFKGPRGERKWECAAR